MSPRKAGVVRGGCGAIVLGGDKPPRGPVARVWFVLCLWICLVTHTGLGRAPRSVGERSRWVSPVPRPSSLGNSHSSAKRCSGVGRVNGSWVRAGIVLSFP